MTFSLSPGATATAPAKNSLAAATCRKLLASLLAPHLFTPTSTFAHRHLTTLIVSQLRAFALVTMAITSDTEMPCIHATPTFDRYYSHPRSKSNATATSADTNSPTVVSTATTLASTNLTSPTIALTYPSPELEHQQRANFSMTTYYYHDKIGRLQSASPTQPSPYSIPDQPVAQGIQGQLDLSYFLERGDLVGAYLAERDHRALLHPAHTLLETSIQAAFKDGGYSASSLDARSNTALEAHLHHQSVEYNESYRSYPPDSRYPDFASTIGFAGFAAHLGRDIPYPDVEDIRHLHTLHSLLAFIQPERKLNSLEGQTMNMVETETGEVFAYRVPKKLLVLFLGRKVVTKYIRTTEREDNDNWCGKPVKQELRIPPGVGSKEAFRVLVSWMLRACQHRTLGQMRQFRVPNNTLTACALSQILTLFGLYKDALRVDWIIKKENFTRPIFPVELEALWNRLGENNRYVYAAIKAVGQQLREYEISSTRKHPMWEEMMDLLEEYPPLKARVRGDLELNEKYSPTFSTEWCKKLGIQPPQTANEPSSSKAGSVAAEQKLGMSSPPEVLSPLRISKKPTRKATILRIVL